MVPEEKRLAVEMGAKCFRVDLKKTARNGRFAGAKVAQVWCCGTIYSLHVFASFIPWNSELPRVPGSLAGESPGLSAENIFRIWRVVHRKSGRPETRSSPSAPTPMARLWIVFRSFESRLTRKLSVVAQESIHRTPGSV